MVVALRQSSPSSLQKLVPVSLPVATQELVAVLVPTLLQELVSVPVAMAPPQVMWALQKKTKKQSHALVTDSQ